MRTKKTPTADPRITLCIVDCKNREKALFAYKESLNRMHFEHRIFLTSLDITEEPCIKISPIRSLVSYSHFCINEMHKYIHTDFVLIIQHDGFILNANAWDDDWFDYDYIGSPWWHKHDIYQVGNGGFSFRSKRLLHILSTMNLPKYQNEDIQICRHYRKKLEDEHGIKFAPTGVAKYFGVEGTDRRPLVWNGEFGFHNQRGNHTFFPPEIKMFGE